MLQYALPIAFTIFVWWFSTGAILYLDGLPRRTFKWTLGAATLLLALALAGLAVTADDTRVTGAYLAFVCSLVVWAWAEVALLLGFVTGSRRTACPPDARGWRRAGFALQSVLHHELALAVLALAVTLAVGDGPNQTGWWTFVVLWTMRQSAKLNIFLGVRNLGERLLPPHLAYLQSYFRRRAVNALFPVSLLASIVAAVLLWQAAAAVGASPHEVAALSLLGSLLVLGIVEHVFMVMPLPADALWNWGLRSRLRRDEVGAGAA